MCLSLSLTAGNQNPYPPPPPPSSWWKDWPDCLKGGGSADRTHSGHLGALFPLRRWCLWAAFWQRSGLRCLRVIMGNIVAGKQENKEDVCVWLISHLLPLHPPLSVLSLWNTAAGLGGDFLFKFFLHFFSLLNFQSVTNALALTTWLEDPSIFCLPLPRYFSLSSFHHPDSPHPLSIIAFSPQVVFIERLRMHRLLPSTGPMQVFPPWLSLCTSSSTRPPPPSPSLPRRRPTVYPSLFFSGGRAHAPLTCFLSSCLPFTPAVSLSPPVPALFWSLRFHPGLLLSVTPRGSRQHVTVACFAMNFWWPALVCLMKSHEKRERGGDASFVGLKAVLFIGCLLKTETGFVRSWNFESWRNWECFLISFERLKELMIWLKISMWNQCRRAMWPFLNSPLNLT